MDGVYNIDNQVAKIAKEHQIITEYVVKFNKSLKRMYQYPFDQNTSTL